MYKLIDTPKLIERYTKYLDSEYDETKVFAIQGLIRIKGIAGSREEKLKDILKANNVNKKILRLRSNSKNEEIVQSAWSFFEDN